MTPHVYISNTITVGCQVQFQYLKIYTYFIFDI